ncbi:hypothetical protein BKK39_08310 [Bacillus cereus]|nr:hypothetical protein BAQ46_28230 [Bacillus paranthracis]ONG99582.1 hypothetical protein BKK39_08310 [Bacillus cereus]
MLIGLRIALGLFTLLILFLCTYIQITDHFSLLPYVQFILSFFFILVGINEFISGRKSMSIPFFFRFYSYTLRSHIKLPSLHIE